LSISASDPSMINTLSTYVREAGFDHFGFAELTRPITIDLYEAWLDAGKQGEMSWLREHLPLKQDPTKLLPRARSAIVMTQNYVPHPAPALGWPLRGGVGVAAYARGRDYHRFLGARVRELAARLKVSFPEHEFLSFTDSAPVLERDLAQRAGLGWVGKNTCLIDRARGSLFWIAEIYTTLELPVARLDLSADFCGTCTRCLDACPTGALKGPRELDARLCISYLTIESRALPPIALRSRMGDWLFGCDICQTVCPWNVKAHGRSVIDALGSGVGAREDLIEDLRYILVSPNRLLEREFGGTPLWRSGGILLKRNALVVVANRKVVELRDVVESLRGNPRLGELAEWALEQLSLLAEH
jgi:epoxyqueuosine reductase